MKMSRKKLIISIFVLVVIALAVSFWFWQKNTQKPVEKEVVNQEQKIDEIDTSDWETYRNEELGIELQYPYGVTLEEVDNKILFKFSDISGHFWVIIKNNEMNLDAESIAANYHVNDGYGYSYEESFVTFNDMQSYKQARYDLGIIENFYIPRKGKIYQINFEFNFNTSNIELKRKIEKRITKINSTFKFIN